MCRNNNAVIILSEYESVCYRAADGSGAAELDLDIRGGEEAMVAILSLSLYNFVKEKKKKMTVRDPAKEMQLWVSTEGGVCVPYTVQGLWNPFILVRELGV